MNLHARIMNVLCDPEASEATYERRIAYSKGHRDARHAAAEIANEAEAELAALRAERDALRDALEDIASSDMTRNGFQMIARAALAHKGE
jgi:hypothetical protein